VEKVAETLTMENFEPLLEPCIDDDDVRSREQKRVVECVVARIVLD
jgi:hypothetical protein